MQSFGNELATPRSCGIAVTLAVPVFEIEFCIEVFVAQSGNPVVDALYSLIDPTSCLKTHLEAYATGDWPACLFGGQLNDPEIQASICVMHRNFQALS